MSETAKNCETCRYDLGGVFDHCAINLEDECGKGGFEAWEGKNKLPGRDVVLKGLVSCGADCAGMDCPYYPILYCETKLHNDAIALLRAGDKGEARP